MIKKPLRMFSSMLCATLLISCSLQNTPGTKNISPVQNLSYSGYEGISLPLLEFLLPNGEIQLLKPKKMKPGERFPTKSDFFKTSTLRNVIMLSDNKLGKDYGSSIDFRFFQSTREISPDVVVTVYGNSCSVNWSVPIYPVPRLSSEVDGTYAYDFSIPINNIEDLKNGTWLYVVQGIDDGSVEYPFDVIIDNGPEGSCGGTGGGGGPTPTPSNTPTPSPSPSSFTRCDEGKGFQINSHGSGEEEPQGEEANLVLFPSDLSDLIKFQQRGVISDEMRRDVKSYRDVKQKIKKLKQNLVSLDVSTDNIDSILQGNSYTLSPDKKASVVKKVDSIAEQISISKSVENNFALRLSEHSQILSSYFDSFKTNKDYTFGAEITSLELEDKESTFLNYKNVLDVLLNDIESALVHKSTFALVSATHNYLNLHSVYSSIISDYGNGTLDDPVSSDFNTDYNLLKISDIHNSYDLIQYTHKKLKDIQKKIDNKYNSINLEYEKLDAYLDQFTSELSNLETALTSERQVYEELQSEYLELRAFAGELENSFSVQSFKLDAIEAFPKGSNSRFIDSQTVNYLNSVGRNYSAGNVPKLNNINKNFTKLQNELHGANIDLKNQAMAIASDYTTFEQRINHIKELQKGNIPGIPNPNSIEKELLKRERKDLHEKLRRLEDIQIRNELAQERLEKIRLKAIAKEDEFNSSFPDTLGPLVSYGVKCNGTTGHWEVFYGPKW